MGDQEFQVGQLIDEHAVEQSFFPCGNDDVVRGEQGGGFVILDTARINIGFYRVRQARPVRCLPRQVLVVIDDRKFHLIPRVPINDIHQRFAL